MQKGKVNLCESEKSELFILKDVKAGKLSGGVVGTVAPAPFRFVMVVIIFTSPPGWRDVSDLPVDQKEGSSEVATWSCPLW